MAFRKNDGIVCLGGALTDPQSTAYRTAITLIGRALAMAGETEDAWNF